MKAAVHAGVITIACAVASSTVLGGGSLHSAKDPDATVLPIQAKLMVLCDCSDLAVIQDVEDEFIGSLKDETGIQPIAGSSVLFPTRTYSAEEREHSLDQVGIEHMLIISVKSNERLTKTVAFGTAAGGVSSAVAREKDAGLVSDFDLALENRKGGPQLWIGAMHVSGSDQKDVADELADDVVSDLVKKSVLPRRPPKRLHK